MKALSVALVFLFAAALAFAAPPLPKDVHCLVVIDGANEFRTMLGKPVPLSDAAKEFEKVGQSMKTQGAVFNDAAATRRGQAVIDAAKSGNYEVGQICYVLQRYCAPGCTGNGCATIRVPSVQ